MFPWPNARSMPAPCCPRTARDSRSKKTLRLGEKSVAAATPPAFYSVPWKEKLAAVGRIMMSQTPFHNPAHEPLPEFADEWFARWDRGSDVTHWYTAG